MSKTSDRHLVENEVVFRQNNERIQKGLERLKKAAKQDGLNLLGKNADAPLHFYCECSDENCEKRIVIKPSQYKKLHKTSTQFLILPGHQVASIERIITKDPDYLVVEKYMTPPQDAKLHPTDINNT